VPTSAELEALVREALAGTQQVRYGPDIVGYITDIAKCITDIADISLI
jgi:hypothetical protein